MPPVADVTAELVNFDGLGFVHFDWSMMAVLAGRMVIAALLGGMVAYRPWRRFMPWTFEPTESGAQLLIAVAGGLITAVIGENIALAFALVGLGGFIRFRSGIKDPREAGVMFLMIAIGMSCGLGMMPIALVATTLGLLILPTLDLLDPRQRVEVSRRIRFSDVAQPLEFEPEARRALMGAGTLGASRVSRRRQEVTVVVIGGRIESAMEVYRLLESANVPFEGDIAFEGT